MTEASFDTIITTSAEVIDFTLRTHECDFHVYDSDLTSALTPFDEELDETLLKIYAKIIDLLHAAAITYANSMRLPAAPGIFKTGDIRQATGITALASQHRPMLEDNIQAELPEKPSIQVVCVPSKTMTLGKYELDPDQSASLGLFLISRITNNFTAILRKMTRTQRCLQGAERHGTVDARILKLLSQLTSLKAKVVNPSL